MEITKITQRCVRRKPLLKPKQISSENSYDGMRKFGICQTDNPTRVSFVLLINSQCDFGVLYCKHNCQILFTSRIDSIQMVYHLDDSPLN